MKENRFITCICRHPIWSAVIVLLLFTIGVPVLINLCYSCDHVIYVTQWEAKDVLAFYASILGALVTLTGLALTITITRKQIQRETYLDRENKKWKNIELCFATILKDIDPVNALNISTSIDTQNPHESIVQLQTYQMTCRTVTSRLSSYISTLDYPKVAPLVEKITEVSEKLFQVANNEVAELSKCYTILIGHNSEEILSNRIRYPESTMSGEIEKYKKAIDDAGKLSIDQVYASLGSKNQELVAIWNTEFQELLQLKGQIFEKIYAQIENDADAILRFGLPKERHPSNGSEKRK